MHLNSLIVSISLAVSTVSAFNLLSLKNEIAIVHGNLTGVNNFAASYLAPFASDDAVETPYELIDDHEDLIQDRRGAIVSLRKRGDDCVKYHKISGDDNCWSLSLKYNVFMESILDWNPQLNSKCTNMYNGKSYCVYKEGATTFETPCIQTHKVTNSDTCTSVIKQYNIDRDSFYDMNPSVDTENCANLLTGAHYCVKLGEKQPVTSTLNIANKVAKKTTSTRRRTKSSRTTRRTKTTRKRTTKKTTKKTTTTTTRKTTTTVKPTTTTTTVKPTTTTTRRTTTTTTTTTTRRTTTSTSTTAKPRPTDESESSNVSDKRKLLQKGSALTYYWIAHPDDYSHSGKTVEVKTCDGKSLGTVSETYANALVMEGTGIIGNKVINLGGCTCHDYKCFMEVDKEEDPFGLTSFGTPLRPFITIAANDIKRNTKIFVPEIEGWEIPGTSKKHNGCLLVDDRSWSFDSNHIDFYVYRERNYRTLNGEHKVSKVDVYEGGDCNLLNYT